MQPEEIVDLVNAVQPGEMITVAEVLEKFSVPDEPSQREIVIAAMLLFEEGGLGKFVRGRKGHPSRYVAGQRPGPEPEPVKVKPVPAEVPVEKPVVLPVVRKDGPTQTLNDDSGVPIVPFYTQKIQLREGFVINFALPLDVSQKEIDGLREFLGKMNIQHQLPSGATVYTDILDNKGKALLPVRE